MDYVSIIIPFVGGLGMFIYGMQIMAQGLENAAGDRMKSLLGVLTKNKFFGVLLGAFITAVIQSSSATTVMVVGFVNAGIMNLQQAMGVIMGANVGTTITGWLVSSVEWAEFLSPSTLAPLAIMLGVIIMLTGKRRSSKDVSSIVIGFGLLFVGISTMSASVAPLAAPAAAAAAAARAPVGTLAPPAPKGAEDDTTPLEFGSEHALARAAASCKASSPSLPTRMRPTLMRSATTGAEALLPHPRFASAAAAAWAAASTAA